MATTPTTVAYRIHPLPVDVLERARRGSPDASGAPAQRVVAEGGEPLRCCLRDARPGEALLLFGYAPPIPPGPYREAGPVFAHAEPCEKPAREDSYPADWRRRPQVLRAYDRRGWIHPTTRVHDGQDPEAAIAEVLAHPDVVQVHSRNVAYGCFMFVVTRSS